MDLSCFCGTTFPTVEALYDHTTSRGHRVQCCCGKLLGTDSQLKNHQRSVKHNGKFSYRKLKALHDLPGKEKRLPDRTDRTFDRDPPPPSLSEAPHPYNACYHCNGKTFKDREAVYQHIRDKHPMCPTCQKVFCDKYKRKIRRSAHDVLFAHQQSTGHCYCAEHKVAFNDEDQFRTHQLTFDFRVPMSVARRTDSEERTQDGEDIDANIPGRRFDVHNGLKYSEEPSTTQHSSAGDKSIPSHTAQQLPGPISSQSFVDSLGDIAGSDSDDFDNSNSGGVLLTSVDSNFSNWS